MIGVLPSAKSSLSICPSIYSYIYFGHLRFEVVSSRTSEVEQARQ